MNILIQHNGVDISEFCLMSDTKIAYDITKRLTTASVTVMGRKEGSSSGLTLKELDQITILDARDGVTKLFDGLIYTIDMVQSDNFAAFDLYYKCTLNDWSAFLDRSVCWDSTYVLPLPCSDVQLITSLITQFCPQITLGTLSGQLPEIQAYDFLNKTCRTVLDDVATLADAEWGLDFNRVLTYGNETDAPRAPFNLSTTPDHVTTFPVNVTAFKRDFSNPVNQCYVRGNWDPSNGILIQASYADPVSIQQYGTYSSSVVDNSIITLWDASLKAKSVVLQGAYPTESGTFTIWKDGLQGGQQVHVVDEYLGVDGDYIIRALALSWLSPDLVQYEAQFGASMPDLETLLRLIAQRVSWATSNPTSAPTDPVVPGPPAPGSVTDISIAPPGLSASSIASVSASTIQGLITANQIGSVNASALIGQLNASQIGSVSAGAIVGSIQASQIGSVNANSIEGVLSASQIGSVSASAITGSITADQIGSVNAPAIQGAIVASQIATVNATSIQGTLNSSQIGTIDAGSISGQIQASQIGSVSATAIQGAIVSDQIASVDASTIQGAITATYFNGNISASQITGTIQASQIGSVSATTIQGQIQSTQISSIDATQITGTIVATEFSGPVSATQITGSISAGQIGSVSAGTIQGVIVSDQLADGIVDDLAKYATALRPIPMLDGVPTLPDPNFPPGTVFYYEPGQSFNTITPDGLSWTYTPDVSGQLTFFNLGAMYASSIVGLILAGQIQSITAGQITGTIQSSQIGSVDASQITGTISSTQIGSVSASQITGQIQASQIASITADQITGSITADVFTGTISATQITGTIQAGQIGSVSATSITGQITSDQISSVTAGQITGPITATYFGGTISASQITGTITADQIDTITAPQISGEIQSTQINTITASQITGTLSASQINSITAGQITGTLSASQIASVNSSAISGLISASQIGSVNASAIQGSISASQISSVNATQISGTISASQIDSVNATTITIGVITDGQIGSVSGSKLIAGNISVGGNGLNVPGVINVYNASNAVVANMGSLGSGQYGGWFAVFGAGGTGYANAMVKTDTSGNLSILNCSLTITNASSATQLTTSPTAFDSTYSSLALNMSGGSDKSSFVSRGMVIYYNGAKVGAFVRSPSTNYSVLEMIGPGGQVLIDCAASTVRADKGFFVGGNGAIGANADFIGPGGVNTTGAVNGNTITAGSSKVLAINSNGTFVGQGVNCPSFGITCAGINPFVGGSQYTGVAADTFKTADQPQRTAWVRGGVIITIA